MPRTDAQIMSAATRLRRDADALLVLVILPEHVIYSDDLRLPPEDARRVLAEEANNIAAHMKANRQKAGRR